MLTDLSNPAQLVTIEEARQLSRLSRQTLHALMTRGELSSVRIGTRRLIHARSLRRLMGLDDAAA